MWGKQIPLLFSTYQSRPRISGPHQGDSPPRIAAGLLASVVGRFLSLGGVEGQEGRLACFKGAGTRRTTAEATVISRAVLEGDGEGAAWTSGTWHRARHRASTS